ncbi:MAG: acetyl-CoA carboxylase biotin carboxyl carrier protein [Gammaproteobacteria bacterium]|nr:acetyl-CoA carboxylase biotin carboxyl carrier protein [Gammaproteobacteria bacterium]MCY4219325.1 acetyl-CoA carboxylase biotin carboxyl carrier protein [Gammaproteobacteria bacterium]MCY4275317.1 acetyl-CoA carboxylase biotin carboxyl carrier protein [Gammaproteobacteria bacterium]
MDLRKIKKLIDLLEKSKLSELEIKQGDDTIRLSRAGDANQGLVSPAHSHNIVSQTPNADIAPSEEKSHGVAVTSPMVGTFFASSEPDAEPFVQVGSVVNTDDTLCILEAMKTFNQVKSDIAGIVISVLKSSGDPVEYGETLFIIDPS